MEVKNEYTTQHNTTQHRVNGLLRLLFVSAMFFGMATKSNAQVICPPGSCPPCMTVELINYTGCPVTWAYEYNPSCSVNPAFTVPPNAMPYLFPAQCMSCNDGPCKCPDKISIVQNSAIGGFINSWGTFSSWTVGTTVVYNYVGYIPEAPCNTGCSNFQVTITYVSPTYAKIEMRCL